MSSTNDIVESALGEEPMKRQALADLTGLEPQTVSIALNQLQAKGRAQRTSGGWVAGDGKAASVRTHVATEPDEERATPKKRSKKQPKVQPKTAKAPRTNGHANGERTLEFAMSECGAILLRKHGSSIWTEMPKADAIALSNLVAARGK
jgi:hypothetical protein